MDPQQRDAKQSLAKETETHSPSKTVLAMDNPIADIPVVIDSLTQAPPSRQQQTIQTYFTPTAAFTHPFCRTGSWSLSATLNSRLLIEYIYRWYKILSPRIEYSIESVAYDPATLTLYVQIAQTFRIWFVPLYAARVSLVTVLKLERDTRNRKYRITCQEDLYQTSEFARFAALGLGAAAVILVQFCATALCVLGALLFYPQTLLADRLGAKSWIRMPSAKGSGKSNGPRADDWKREWNDQEEEREMKEFQRQREEMAKFN